MPNVKGTTTDLKLSIMMHDWIPTWEHMDNPCGAKNLRSEFVYANPAYKRLLGLPSGFILEGRYDHEMPAPTAEFAEEFRLHDRLVEEERMRKSSLEINEFGREKKLSAYFFDKFPIFDYDNNVLGTFFFGRKAVYLNKDFYMNSERPVSIVLTKPSDIFTDKEWDIIFLIMHNLTFKQIAEKVQRSVNTIKAHVITIFNKIGVDNKNQLKDFINANGWGGYIPEKYMSGKKHILFNGSQTFHYNSKRSPKNHP